MIPAARRAGDAVTRGAAELLQVWRAMRAHRRPEVLPGLLDGLLASFLARAGEALAAGRDPALVWPACEGTVRLDPRALDRSRAELDAEWDLAHEVLRSACDALDADDAAAEWIARAVVLARAGTRALDQGGPPGVLLVWSLAGFRPTRLARAGGRP